MKYTVKRSEWYRGQGSGASCLIRSNDSLKCCLGFVGEQRAIAPIRLIGRPYPDQDDGNWPNWFFNGLPLLYSQLANINDDDFIGDADRELQLAAIFAKHGDELVFED